MKKIIKDDPMWYVEKMKELFEVAENSNINIFTDEVLGKQKLYFEASQYERWSIELPAKPKK